MSASDNREKRESVSEQTTIHSAQRAAPPIADLPLPRQIGRYIVKRVLGNGSFGLVYLAYDDQLSRLVAVKVPHAGQIRRSEDLEIFLEEARMVATLDHPNIVPIYDVGKTPEHPFFIVSKFIEGTTLTERIRVNLPSIFEATQLVRVLAHTLHYAHQMGLVHRDIKPGNILLESRASSARRTDSQVRDAKESVIDFPIPYITDFGLALREQDIGLGPRCLGTPSYMSPEQARGEGHRVDGRSDIFSLGVVLYELLTGRRPFHAEDTTELLNQIGTMEARPPRQWNDALPKELERICLKALAKKASERYLTARDFADDLEHFQQSQQGQPEQARADHGQVQPGGQEASTIKSPSISSPVPPASSDSLPIKIVPRGLRSFDTRDADFFLELLPGPRDRNGLPDSIRFWKTKIEEADDTGTLTVGLIYGPSGCGKSSLVKAGLLPLLHAKVTTIYVESTGAQTEARLLAALRKRWPELSADFDLKDALSALRRGQCLPDGHKILLVLDQFEQWLHAQSGTGAGSAYASLVEALRQCDGRRVQCILMVRDDFWLAVSRFLKELEVQLLEGQNSAMVDLFDTDHAAKVLKAFGRAFGKLPENTRDTTKEQKQYLTQAVADLAQTDKVICVRLALFAEMMKGKPWRLASLKAVGGAAGVGVTFLEETFSLASASPEHRYHQRAARAVLGALLPDAGADIKGHIKSYQELLETSGYTNRPRDFADLMRILDSELRLITPTDPEAPVETVTSETGTSDDRQRATKSFYQLTHDYLVHSLRDWLTRKQKETRRGRAELRLAERGELWRIKPERRQLVSFTEWLSIRLLTNPRAWTTCQRQMMRAAAVKHLKSGACIVFVVLLLGGAALLFGEHLAQERALVKADGLVRGLLNAKIGETKAIIDELAGYRPWATPMLEKELADPGARRDRQLNARLALVRTDPSHVPALRESLLTAEGGDFAFIRDALSPARVELIGEFWGLLEENRSDADRCLRAAAALASYDDPASPRWQRNSRFVAERLVAQPSLTLPLWVSAFRPVKGQLLPSLAALLRERSTQPGAAVVVAEVLSEYGEDQAELIAQTLAHAPPDAFAILLQRLLAHESEAAPLLTKVLEQIPPPEGAAANEAASQRANIILALFRLGSGERLWPMLKASDYPRVRSFLIDRFASLGCKPEALLARLADEPDDDVRAALWLGLGGFDEQALPAARRAELAPKLVSLQREDPSRAVHGAVTWLLGQWKVTRSEKPRGEAALADLPRQEKEWYVNRAGQTMVRINGPETFMMGSLPSERGRDDREIYHETRIDHSYDIGMTEVTIGQFREFLRHKGRDDHPAMNADLDPAAPVTGIKWYEAVEYCNWLSKLEELPVSQWCYEPNPDGHFDRGMKIAPLSERRIGYRLPTETEWEYACRAGTTTSRCYGDATSLLARYAWYSKEGDETWAPVGQLLPNAFGLFDMHGNAQEWCHNLHLRYDEPPNLEVEIVQSEKLRAIRGGGVTSAPGRVRSAKRFSERPSNADASGFRLARYRP